MDELQRNHRSPLREMANLRPKTTGLSKGVIYISTRDGAHEPRVKYFHHKPHTGASVSVTISNDPQIVAGDLRLSSRERAELFAFICLNERHLLRIWNEGLYMGLDQWLDGIVPI